MKIKIVAHTPVKYFESKPRECTKSEYEQMLVVLKRNDKEYLTIETCDGEVILNEDMLKVSVLGIAIVEK